MRFIAACLSGWASLILESLEVANTTGSSRLEWDPNCQLSVTIHAIGSSSSSVELPWMSLLLSLMIVFVLEVELSGLTMSTRLSSIPCVQRNLSPVQLTSLSFACTSSLIGMSDTGHIELDHSFSCFAVLAGYLGTCTSCISSMGTGQPAEILESNELSDMSLYGHTRICTVDVENASCEVDGVDKREEGPAWAG